MAKTSVLTDLDSLLAEFDSKPTQKQNYSSSQVSQPVSRIERQGSIVSTNTMCAKCNLKIVGELVIALDRSWHTTCFACDQCKSPLAADFFEFEGGRLCKNCINAKVRCTKCSKPIIGEYLVGDGSFFHLECVEISNCAKCNQKITPTQLKTSALNKIYHSSCFVCTDCGNGLSKSFFNNGGFPFCESCSKKPTSTTSSAGNCWICKKSILPGSEFVQYEGRGYHEDCFCCYNCKKHVNPAAFYNVNGNPACSDCAHK